MEYDSMKDYDFLYLEPLSNPCYTNTSFKVGCSGKYYGKGERGEKLVSEHFLPFSYKENIYHLSYI